MSVRRRSISPRLFGAAIFMSAALGSQPLAAQWFGAFITEGPIPPQRILSQLRGRGFSDISRPRFDGSVYLIEALNPWGLRVRLVIDAYDGEIVERHRLADPLLLERGSGRMVGLDPFASPRTREPPRPERTEPQTRKKARVEPPRGPKSATPAQPGQNGPPASPAAPSPSGEVSKPAAPPEGQSATTAGIPPPSVPPVVPPAQAPPSKAEPPTDGPSPAVEASSEQRSVRVIEGVTPIGPAPNRPASEPKPEDESAAGASPPPQWRDVPAQRRP